MHSLYLSRPLPHQSRLLSGSSFAGIYAHRKLFIQWTKAFVCFHFCPFTRCTSNSVCVCVCVLCEERKTGASFVVRIAVVWTCTRDIRALVQCALFSQCGASFFPVNSTNYQGQHLCRAEMMRNIVCVCVCVCSYRLNSVRKHLSYPFRFVLCGGLTNEKCCVAR